MTDWPAWIAAVAGTIGAVAGIGAAVVAIPAWRAGKVNAAATVRAAKATEDNVQAAERAAKAAENAAAEARRLSRLEQDRWHGDLSPARSLKVTFDMKSNERLGGGHGSLMAVIELPRSEAPRTYRVRGVARVDDSYWELGLPLLLRSGEPTTVEIEKWPPDRSEPQAKDLLLRFWPPADVDQVEPWDLPVWPSNHTRGRPRTCGSLGGANTSHLPQPNAETQIFGLVPVPLPPLSEEHRRSIPLSPETS